MAPCGSVVRLSGGGISGESTSGLGAGGFRTGFCAGFGGAGRYGSSLCTPGTSRSATGETPGAGSAGPAGCCARPH